MNRIVIGVDGSLPATAAARWAACEAARWPAIPLPAEVGEGQFARGEAILEDTLSVIAKTIGAQQPGSIGSKVCVGAVVHRLCQPTSRSKRAHDETRRFLVCCWRRRVAKGFNRIGSATALLLTDALSGPEVSFQLGGCDVE